LGEQVGKTKWGRQVRPKGAGEDKKEAGKDKKVGGAKGAAEANQGR
jgi:hypothetical protein